jgi:hypothetical protein
MYTIRHATEAFAKLDGTPEDQVASLDKALRNITTRVYLAPKGRDGLAYLYDLAGICALRLIYKATVFGLDRWMLEDFARWMQNQPVGTARRVAVDGGFRSQTPIEEGIDRANEGRRFDFNVILYTDGHLQHYADWADDDQKSAAVAEGIFAAAGLSDDAKPKQDARFVLPASRHLADLIAAMGA